MTGDYPPSDGSPHPRSVGWAAGAPAQPGASPDRAESPEGPEDESGGLSRTGLIQRIEQRRNRPDERGRHPDDGDYYLDYLHTMRLCDEGVDQPKHQVIHEERLYPWFPERVGHGRTLCRRTGNE